MMEFQQFQINQTIKINKIIYTAIQTMDLIVIKLLDKIVIN